MSIRLRLRNAFRGLTGGQRPRLTAEDANAPVRRRPVESGFAFLLALMILVVMTASIITLLEIGATQRQRAREEETIWRGNQYLRAIRLFYHKTGRYPQTMDDLVKGMPQLRFLRQQYKNPMDPASGDWRLIYVNQAGQIIGSTKYATLQQMALIDLNGGVMPGTQQIPGQPGVPVSALSSSGSNSDSSQGQNPASGTGSSGAGTTGGSGNPTQPGSTSSDPNGQPPQDPSQPGGGQPPTGGQNPLSGSGVAGPGGILSGLPGQAPGSTGQNGSLNQTNIAALTALKPTGPVDGPVLGAFLTGVACTGDRKSMKFYHGGKKYVEWEFIWNPLEDAAAAQQQQASSGQGGILGGAPAAAGGLGGITGGTGSSFGSSFGSSPSNPGQPSQPQPQQPQTPQQ